MAALLLLFGMCGSLSAQEKEIDSKFDKEEAFSPLFMTEMGNSFHSSTGNPGPDYWQNQADYTIEATLDTINHRVEGKMKITYTNNSPYKLNFLWIQMDQNAFRDDSKSKALYPAGDRNGVRTPTAGYELEHVKIKNKEADYLIDDTRMQIRLDKPLKANGKKIKIDINYAFDIPTHGKDRMGRVETDNGTIYTIAQWYPRMAVYDEVEGWNNIPYLGTGEFYLEYGDFNYEITAPENMVVAGSGILKNEGKVLTKKQKKRLKKARESDETVDIVTKSEMKSGEAHKKGKDGMKTWKFTMKNSRDVAWAASKAFIWDAAKMNLPNGKEGLAQSVYPAENSGEEGYARSTEYTKNAIEIYSKDLFPYPYEVATNVGAHEGGMEYPGIVFCSYRSQGKSLWDVVNHEFGHIWFPMIVGSNERVHAWLDEGLNTFINDLASEQFNDGEYAEKQDFQNSGSMMFDSDMVPLFTRADVIHDQQNLGIGAYYKPAYGLHVLRNVVLGEERFDYALNEYIKRWKYKHPQPWDFFNTMSNASGEDLGWFFKGWFMKKWSIDQAVESIDYKDGNPENGAEITLANKGEMPMPTTIKVVYEDEQSEIIDLPVEIWMTGPEYVYHLDSDKKIRSVEIDPEHLVPDNNPSNNKMKNLTAAPEDVTAETVIDEYFKAVGGKEQLENLKDLSIKMKATIQGTPINIVEKIKTPDKYYREMEVFGQKLLEIKVSGDDYTLINQGQQQEVDEEQKEALNEMVKSRFIELNFKKDYELKLLGVDKVGSDEVYVIEATNKNKESNKYYYATDSGLKLKETGMENSSKTFSDYKDVDGLKIPYQATEFMQGQEFETEIEEIKINEGIEDSDFE